MVGERGAVSTRDTVLSLLARGPLTGADIVARSDGRLSRGTVYVHLAAMERDGVIVGHARGDGSRLYERAATAPRT